MLAAADGHPLGARPWRSTRRRSANLLRLVRDKDGSKGTALIERIESTR
jgi:hypothetical protein